MHAQAIENDYISGCRNAILAHPSDTERFSAAVGRLGSEIGRLVQERIAVAEDVAFNDRLGGSRTGPMLQPGLSVVVTTSGESSLLGVSVARATQPSVQGFMNFEGRRGPAALSTPVRDVHLPDVGGRRVRSVIIAKSLLASGCTAISLARAATEHYRPEFLFIAALFYSASGVDEISTELREGNLILFGEPHGVNEDGTLAVGFIDELQ